MATASLRHFGCTQCGKCCQGWRLRLGLEEAQAWARRGHGVEILLSGGLWPDQPPPEHSPAAEMLARCFRASAGGAEVAVHVTLVGAFGESCPNLRADKGCAIYAERPLVCRLYPVKPETGLQIDPLTRRCPPEAWAMPEREPEAVLPLLAEARRRATAEVEALARLCRQLGLDRCALLAEGVVACHIEAERFLAACGAAAPEAGTRQHFRLISGNSETIAELGRLGVAHEVPPPAGGGLAFLPFGALAA
ncbi:YkgJ family cysteine cluster protein [Rhodovarius crocodyli]|nr:YkgJ family cysteine cluster protein [Rhodovarius crocodyli]